MEGALREALRRAMRARVENGKVQTLAAYYEQMEALAADINGKIREPKIGKEAP